MAGELGLRADVVREIGVAGRLHDIGKVGVAHSLLCKPGRLTPGEYRQVMQHVLIGERILKPALGGFFLIMGVVRWHHERFDGNGFPDGLAGHQLPLAARITAVADAFDAMTSARPYRAALDFGSAVAELEEHAGSQFDRVCVDTLLSVIDGDCCNRTRYPGTRAGASVQWACRSIGR